MTDSTGESTQDYGPYTVGELRWAEQTRGILGRSDRLRLLAQGLLIELQSAPVRARRALGLRTDRLARLDPDAVRLPDSAACREIERLCSEMTPPIVFNHSQRSYVWSVILAHHDNIRFDEELLYVASMAHDLGFVSRPAPTEPECFTLVGAREARALAAPGWDEQRGRLAAEAITLHLNLRVDPSRGTEAHLLWAGSRLDAVGLRWWDIEPATVAMVLDRYPRLQLKEYFVQVFEAETASSPGSRTAFYTRFLGANRRVRRARFSE
jgi:hypothetical protein